MEELERTSTRGFRAALLYPTVDGEMVVDLPVMDPLYAKIAELEWPIFLHGAGLAKTQRSNGSKTVARVSPTPSFPMPRYRSARCA